MFKTSCVEFDEFVILLFCVFMMHKLPKIINSSTKFFKVNPHSLNML